MSPLQKEFPEPEPVFNFAKLMPGRHVDKKYQNLDWREEEGRRGGGREVREQAVV